MHMQEIAQSRGNMSDLTGAEAGIPLRPNWPEWVFRNFQRAGSYFFPHFIASMSPFISPLASDFIEDIECAAPPLTGIMAWA